MSLLWSPVAGALVATLAGQYFWPTRRLRVISAGVVGGVAGGLAWLGHPILFLAENGPLVSAAFYGLAGCAIGLVVGGIVRALAEAVQPPKPPAA